MKITNKILNKNKQNNNKIMNLQVYLIKIKIKGKKPITKSISKTIIIFIIV